MAGGPLPTAHHAAGSRAGVPLFFCTCSVPRQELNLHYRLEGLMSYPLDDGGSARTALAICVVRAVRQLPTE